MSKEKKQECCDGHNDEDLHKKSFRHFDGSDCIGCDRRPLPVEESQPIDLDYSEEFASQSEESPDASDSPPHSEDEDEEMAMEDVPEDEILWRKIKDADRHIAHKEAIEAAKGIVP